MVEALARLAVEPPAAVSSTGGFGRRDSRGPSGRSSTATRAARPSPPRRSSPRSPATASWSTPTGATRGTASRATRATRPRSTWRRSAAGALSPPPAELPRRRPGPRPRAVAPDPARAVTAGGEAREPLGYRAVRRFAGLLLGLFYRHVEIAGAERIPRRARWSSPRTTRTPWSIRCSCSPRCPGGSVRSRRPRSSATR